MATVSEAATRLDTYRDLARQLRVDSIRCSTAAGSGHPTSSLSAADLIAVLLAGHLRYDFANPRDPANDHLIFSKGHASPLVYAVLRAAGAIDDDELAEIDDAYSRARGAERPTAILAKTVKGKGVSFLENKEGWHGRALDPEQARQALAELGQSPARTFAVTRPGRWEPPVMRKGPVALKTYAEPGATRKAYGEALAALGAARGG